jgi:CspA family cold shock protein
MTKGRNDMPKGKVKWFDRDKGFGFIEPEEGGDDVFVHVSAVKEAGMDDLKEDQVLEYELKTERGRTAAGDLKAA